MICLAASRKVVLAAPKNEEEYEWEGKRKHMRVEEDKALVGAGMLYLPKDEQRGN